MKKKIIIFIFTALSMSFLVSCSNISKEEYDTVSKEVSTLQDENTDLTGQLKTLTDRYNSLNDDYSELKTKCDEYEAIIEPYKDLSEAEVTLKAKEAQAELDKIAEEEAAKAAEEAAAKEKEEKKGYNTGITYDQLARTPDDYKNKKVKFTGEVIQVIEGDTTTSLRLAIDSDYDQVIYIEYNSSIVKSRVLEDDIITIYGVSYGLISYQSTLGGTITIPAVEAEKIDQ